jgi:hypothetical protein
MRLGCDAVLVSDPADPPGELDVALSHPRHALFGTTVVGAVGRIVTDQRQVDEWVGELHVRVVARRLSGLAHRSDEPEAGDEVAGAEPRVKGLAEFPPVVKLGVEELFSREHVHDGTTTRWPLKRSQ